MPARVIERELIPADSSGPDRYCISGAYVAAGANNVSIEIPETAGDCCRCFIGGGSYPRCPDCKSGISLAPGDAGSRQCRTCGSRFADMRYSGQAAGLHMPAMEAEAA